MEVTKEANPKLVSLESLVCHCLGLSSSDESNTRLMRLNNTARIFAGFQVPIKAANQPSQTGRLEIFTIFSSSSYHKFTDIFIKLFWQDFLVLLLSLSELRNSVSKLTSLRVFERVFLLFRSSINLSIGLSRDTNLLDCSASSKISPSS